MKGKTLIRVLTFLKRKGTLIVIYQYTEARQRDRGRIEPFTKVAPYGWQVFDRIEEAWEGAYAQTIGEAISRAVETVDAET